MIAQHGIFCIFIFASGIFKGSCGITAQIDVDFTSNVTFVEDGCKMYFICSGLQPELKVRDSVQRSLIFNTTSVIHYNAIATLHDNNTEASCNSSDSNRVTKFFIYTPFKLNNDTVYDVTLGQEQSIVIPYEKNPNFGEIHLTKNGSSVQNFYVTKMSNFGGEIVIHFPKVTEDDLGIYVITTSVVGRTIEHDVMVQGRDADSATVDDRDIAIIASPAISFSVCIIVIITAVCLVKRKSRSGMNSKKENLPTKNHYVASGEGIPAQPRALRDETSPHRPPHNPTQQHQNSATLEPPITKRTTALGAATLQPNSHRPIFPSQLHAHNSSVSLEPPVTKRTTSLGRAALQPNPHQPIFPSQLHANNRLSSQSLDSVDSFENCEEEYENCAIPNCTADRIPMPRPIALADRNFHCHGRPQSAITPHNLAMPQRHHAASDVRPAVKPKPTKHLYQNQIATQMNMNILNEQDDEEQIYEGMN